MKANINKPVKPCPFCGGSISITNGFIGAAFLFFKCNNKKCGAIISFDNDKCNAEPNKAKAYFERRVKND